jgi:L,D-transpeptidase ErfK/SrfK
MNKWLTVSALYLASVSGEGGGILLPGRRILPPTPHEGIVVNLPEHRLYFYPKLDAEPIP